MQFPSEENLGNDCQNVPNWSMNKTKKASKKVLKVPESYKTVKSHSIRKAKLYAPSVAVDISKYLDNELLNSWKIQSWLQKIADTDNNILVQISFGQYPKCFIKRNVVLPIFPKYVHTLSTHYHYMEIIKQTIAYLNPGQTYTINLFLPW